MISKYDFFDERNYTPNATKDGYYINNLITSTWSENYLIDLAQVGGARSDIIPLNNRFYAAFGFNLADVNHELIVQAILKFYLLNNPIAHAGEIVVKVGNNIFSDPLDGSVDNANFSKLTEIHRYDFDGEASGRKELEISLEHFISKSNFDILFEFDGTILDNELVIWQIGTIEKADDTYNPFLYLKMNYPSSMAKGR